jgi:hypothetical protein
MTDNHDKDGAVGRGIYAANKKTALAGEWQTPPMVAYPSYATAPSTTQTQAYHQGQQPPQPTQQHQQYQQQQQQQQYQQQQQQQHEQVPSRATSGPELMTSLPPVSNLPDNSEEYAKALQEAYRKGAEAAARMAAQQIPTAASCPNFSTGSGSQFVRTSSQLGIGISPVEEESTEYNLDHQIHPPPPQNQTTITAAATITSAIPDPLSSSMPPPPPPSAYPGPAEPFMQPPIQQQQQQHHHQHQQSYMTTESPMTTQQQQQQSVVPVHQTHYSHGTTTATNPHLAVAPAPPPAASAPGRSLSMPDMSTYTAEAEEEKRLKRLARNRASARLRRLRKKNLVSNMNVYVYVYMLCQIVALQQDFFDLTIRTIFLDCLAIHFRFIVG